jgi:hypothetical protein
MKKFLRTKATAKLGVTFVQSVVYETGSIFRELPEDTDLGVDGHIEFVEDEVAIGLLVGVQVKAGHSYLTERDDGRYFRVSVSKEDLSYWSKYPIPIALIVYDPETELSGWLDITGYVRGQPEVLNQETIPLYIHAVAQPFNPATLQGKFRATFQSYRLETDLYEFAELMASHDPDEKLRGLIGLMSHPKSRFSKLTCFLLLQHLFHTDMNLRSTVSDMLSRYLDHPEVGYYPSKDIRDYVRCALKDFGRYQIEQLLETALLDEDNLMHRGTVSQSVGVIIASVPHHEQYLYELARDTSLPAEIRIVSLVLAASFGMQTTIGLIATDFDLITWGDAYEAAQWAVGQYVDLDEGIDIGELIDQKGYDSYELADALDQAGIAFLVKNEWAINRIIVNSTNPYVLRAASRAESKIPKWRDPSTEENPSAKKTACH